MMKLGVTNVLDQKKQKNRKADYKDVYYDEHGWADAVEFLPHDFDLVYMKTDVNENPIAGWSIGKQWDGKRLRPEAKVSHWKRWE